MFDFFQKCLNWLQEIFNYISNAFTVILSSIKAVFHGISTLYLSYPLFQSILPFMPTFVVSCSSIFVVLMILRFLLLR